MMTAPPFEKWASCFVFEDEDEDEDDDEDDEDDVFCGTSPDI